MKKIISTLLLLLLTNISYSWSLKTHIWIAQQVLNDVLDDGQLTLLNRKYPVPTHIVNALRNHPDKFRMGSLGADVFPDPIVGQTTTHPGVVGGWQTDVWLRHLLVNAKTPEEIAFSYGFAVHACSDIFAHTYVNAYAGDIFVLTDNERDVENRHFVLEKFIEKLTPEPQLSDGTLLDWSTALGVPSAFLSKYLILDREVFKQYLKAKSGIHLSSMYGVKVGVEKLNKTANQLISDLTSFGSDFFKKQLKLQADIASGKLTLEAVESGLDIQLKILNVKRKAHEAALAALSEANNIIQKHPELITAQNKLLSEQIKIAADLTAKSASIAADVANAKGKLQNEINELRGNIASNLASVVCIGLVWPPAIKKCREKADNIVKDINNKISDIEKTISGDELRAETAEKIAAEAAKKRDDIKQELDKLQATLDNAVRNIADKTFEAVVTATELELKSQELAVEKAKEGVIKAQELVNKIQNELDKIDPIVDEIKKAIDRFNPITLLVGNWLRGIDKSSEEYINASHQAGLKMLANNGNPLTDYKDWYKCYGQVFIAKPVQVGQAGCLVEKYLDEIKNEYDKLIDGLPTLLKWMINPTREATKIAYKELEPELKKAEFEILKFTTDPTTAEFLMLLANPTTATQDKLVSIYKKDNSGKKLLLFNDVSSFILKDLVVENGILNVNKFAPLANSVTLSKLALLDPRILNQLIKDNVGDYTSTMLGKEIYQSDESNYCLLFEAIRSIDGNHQWQAFGLPYPKRISGQTCSEKHNYGYNYFQDPSKGFKLWIDPYIREKVFLPLFPGSMLGALGQREELKPSFYNYQECPQNPYPSTQDATGNIVPVDLTCTNISNPMIPVTELGF